MMFIENGRLAGPLALTATTVLLASLAGVPADAVGNAGAARGDAVAEAPAAPCRTPVDLRAGGAGDALVNRFDVGNHESGEDIRYDRVVIGLDGPAISYQARYVPLISQDGSGAPVTLRGNADLEVVVEGAAAHRNGESSVPVRRYTRDWLALREARIVSDFEGYVRVGLGVANPADFVVSTLTNPDRLVVDVAVPGTHPWNCASGAVRVYFFNSQNFIDNIDPFFVPVWRRVATPAVAGGALYSLFHGPTLGESRAGLSLLASGATGFADLRIQNGYAHVRLTGGCNSGGSTVTIGTSIIRTLSQFSSVRYVKIYDPDGQTGDPTGPDNSIPDCLNP